jgi:polyisoprenoid-binding protein YceI
MNRRSIGLMMAAVLCAAGTSNSLWAQADGARASAGGGVRLDLVEGSQARYRVREQLAGISFPNDAVGTSSTVTGTLVLGPNGAVVSNESKLTLDLRTFKSDQERRDGYLQRNTLETETFPLAEFVPRRAEGLPHPFPTEPPAQAGFRLIGDMTLHGVTSELSWNVIATFVEGRVSGVATTSFPFSTFKLEKPTLARLLSVDDTINLELEFRASITPTTTR